MNRIITLTQLEELGACKKQRELFEAKFGADVRVTQELCRSVATEFDWDWAADELLTESAWVEYGKARMIAWAECDKAAEAARVNWVASGLTGARADAMTNWAARVEYDKARAVAFARAFNAEENWT